VQSREGCAELQYKQSIPIGTSHLHLLLAMFAVVFEPVAIGT
jgi:hypothetical protein